MKKILLIVLLCYSFSNILCVFCGMRMRIAWINSCCVTSAITAFSCSSIAIQEYDKNGFNSVCKNGLILGGTFALLSGSCLCILLKIRRNNQQNQINLLNQKNLYHVINQERDGA